MPTSCENESLLRVSVSVLSIFTGLIPPLSATEALAGCVSALRRPTEDRGTRDSPIDTGLGAD